ncbi:hypothetical protein [Priestia endophytica]|nr:hypothetical protein [Priestia endophytica]
MTITNGNQHEIEEILPQMPSYFVQNVGQKDDHRIQRFLQF